ncbi:MAG: urate hydroxylase PuuD [Burkholderia sp.]|nr:urate hydroxylase PuuD [Burkholderia sp.]
MEGFITDWLNLALRWLHVIVAIAWIGESFYFVALDNSLKPPTDPNQRKRGVFGELWHVHGGGFYNMQKYTVAPPEMPDDLHWSKWPSYTTWLSGFSLFFVLYLLAPNTYLIDKSVLDMGPVVAVASALGFLAAGWIVYDSLCRVLGTNDRVLGICVGIYVVVAAYLACHIFSGRAAYLIVGAMLATIMSANVFFVIIPGQRKMVAAMSAGATPDPKYGRWGKQRSVHNTYLTLPVLFIMISPHYPMTWQHPLNWLILLVIGLAGALVRQFFVLRQQGRHALWLPAGAVAAMVAAFFIVQSGKRDYAAAEVPPFTEVQAIVAARCVSCHAAKPSFEGIAVAPKGVIMETPGQIRRWAASMRQQVQTEAMPPGNMTEITAEERAKLIAWVAAGAPLD